MALPSSGSPPAQTLLSVLSNQLVLQHTYPFLTIGGLLSLAATCTSFRDLIYSDTAALRTLDLTTARGAGAALAPIDAGGETWRAERMDESVSEHEFYAGPLRGIFSSLRRRGLLDRVHTLVLDGQAAPVEVLHEVICGGGFAVRVLSVRGCAGLKDDDLQGLLRYATRPSRPLGTPALRGVYRFGGHPFSVPPPPPPASGAVGAEWNARSAAALRDSLRPHADPWYSGPRRVLKQVYRLRDWAPILRVCEGLVHFDAVLCRGPRHFLQVPHGDPEYIDAAVASVVLAGCERCGGAPEGAARPSQAPSARLPLLHPPPRHAASIKLAQQPAAAEDDPPLYVRCTACVALRCCESCFRFWCEDCYSEEELRESAAEKRPMTLRQAATDGGAAEEDSEDDDEARAELARPGIKRYCWECGKVCAACNTRNSKRCKSCGFPYCVLHNDDSNQSTCDWCRFSRRRGRELY